MQRHSSAHQSPLTLPPPSTERPVRRDRRSLVIALIISGILLLGTGGVATWVFLNKPSAPGAQAVPKDLTDTKDVKNVTWVPPADLPPEYVKQDANTTQAVTTYYYDDGSACGITTTVSPAAAAEGSTPKEIVLDAADAAYATGVTTAGTADGPDYKIPEEGKEHTYPFSSVDLTQSVNVEGVTFKEQYNIVAFKQFGEKVATIGITCKSGSWDTKKQDLEANLKAFKVKLER